MGSKIKVSLPMTGGCQCGAIKYEINSMPLTLYACHCTECQRQSSSGFGMSMPVPKTGFKIISGNPKYWSRTSNSRRTVKCAFCPECGTRLFHEPLRNKEVVNVKPGTLDKTKWVNPVAHLWLSSAQTGVVIPESKLYFQKQPDSFEPLYQEWLNQYEPSHV